MWPTLHPRPEQIAERACWTGGGKPRSKRLLNRCKTRCLLGLRVDGLVEVNPKDARKEGQHRGERQEQHQRAGDDLGETPTGQKPEKASKNRNEGESQTVADVHGAEKISGLAVEEQITGGAAIIHLWKAPVNAAVHAPVNVRPENLARAASRTELPQDAAESGRPRANHEHHDSG